jgi:DNA-nicking Smr family endonuclease
MPKKNKIRNKNNLPILNSDDDFLNVFEQQEKSNTKRQQKITPENLTEEQKNIDNEESLENEDFATLLEESLKNRQNRSITKSTPLPLKKRLKRYPRVELELDLHGYSAVGAQIELKSFISSCKYQGYFTVRIIVGKGLHSENGAVLPDIVEDELKEMKKQNLIIFYEWDRNKKKTSGAIIVYLKQFEQHD